MTGGNNPTTRSTTELQNIATAAVSVSEDVQRKINNTNYRLPPFSKLNPEAWFAIAEAELSSRGIKEDEERYQKLLIAVGQDNLDKVGDIVLSPPTTGKYENLKKHLKSTFCVSDDVYFKELFPVPFPTLEEGKSPLDLMTEMLKKSSPEFKKSREFRLLFLERLPAEIRPVLSKVDVSDHREYAIEANKLVEKYRSTSSNQVFNVQTATPAEPMNVNTQIAELRAEINALNFNRNRGGFRGRGRGSFSSRESRRPSDICKMHWRHGNKAYTCEPPCRLNGQVAPRPTQNPSLGNGTGRPQWRPS